MHIDNDAILHVLSAKESIPWGAFRSAYEHLLESSMQAHGDETGSATTPEYAYASAAHLLDLLGHCDLSFRKGNSEVFVSPPVLAPLPVRGYPRAVLAGARIPALYQMLDRAAMNSGAELCREAQQTTVPLIPDRIVIEAETQEALQAIASACAVRVASTPPAWSFAAYSGSLQEYLQQLGAGVGYEMEGLTNTLHYDLAKQRFAPGRDQRDGVALESFKREGFSRRFYLLRASSGLYKEVERSWGIWALLSSRNSNVLLYDSRHFTLAVPAGAELPRLLGRSLCLCSGYAPWHASSEALGLNPHQGEHFVFPWIPSPLASVVARKLDQKLVEHNLPYEMQTTV